MTTTQTQPRRSDMLTGFACSIVFCGAPLTRRAVDIVRALTGAGLHVQPVATPAALAWLDVDDLRTVTGLDVLVEHRTPDRPKRAPRPDVAVVAPATFNTVNKLANGIADTYAHASLCEHLGVGRPLVVAPFVNDRLWSHPALPASLRTLESTGVVLLDPTDGGQRVSAVPGGDGERLTDAFQPRWLVDALLRRLGA